MSSQTDITHMPYDVVRHILLFLSSQQDLINAGQASPEIQAVVSDDNLWRDLCTAHFSRQQLVNAKQVKSHCRSGSSGPPTDWFDIYNKLCQYVMSYHIHHIVESTLYL